MHWRAPGLLHLGPTYPPTHPPTHDPEKPPSRRSAAITRWQGTTGACGFRRMPCEHEWGRGLGPEARQDVRHAARLPAAEPHSPHWRTAAPRGTLVAAQAQAIPLPSPPPSQRVGALRSPLLHRAVRTWPTARAQLLSTLASSPYVLTLPAPGQCCWGNQVGVRRARWGCGLRLRVLLQRPDACLAACCCKATTPRLGTRQPPLTPAHLQEWPCTPRTGAA